MSDSDEHEFFLVHVPSLVATLLQAERQNGTPLTKAEVLDLRDEGPCIVMRRSERNAVTEGRGYDDIDPENAWQEWKRIRSTF